MYAVESGARLVIINLSTTPLDAKAAVLISASAGEAMGKIVEKVRSQMPA
jgi:NAD-dependent SIR2 family protein deacetylase